MDYNGVVVTTNDINYSGTILYHEFIENGLIIKPSKKSNVMIWIALDIVSYIILQNGEEVLKEDISSLFDRFDIIKDTYN